MDFLYSIVGFILAIGILVTIHEFGHFYVAKLCKVKVLKFSIGFGPAKCIWQDCSGTKYLISAIPLGGYVELFDSQDPAVDPTIDLKLAINNKSAMDKILISLAGPMANFLLAIIAYWLVFIIGIATPTPIIGQISSDSIAGQARLVSGLEITKVANKTVNNWEDITIALIKQTQAKKKFVVIESYDRSHHKKSRHKLDISDPNLGKASEKILSAVGLLPYQFIDQKIWQVVPNSPADLAGIKVGDLIVTIDDLIMHNNQEVSKYLYDNPNKNVTLGVNRGQKNIIY
jgi:regulator of sigma E protease